MTSPSSRVVLLACGSYNPITNMHLRMFEIARDSLHKLGRQVIAGVISPVHDAYGKKDLISSKHRCNMVRLAAKSSDWVKLDTWECEQEGWVETRTVLEHHQKNLDSLINDNLSPQKRAKFDNQNINGQPTIVLPDDEDDIDNHNLIDVGLNQPVQLKLLCGADLLESFGTPGLWKEEDIEAIVSKFGLVVITRGGSNPYKFIYESDILSRFQYNIHIVTEWITNEISATKIRRALQRGESVKYLIQDSVLDYIKENGLYKSQNKYSSILLTPSPNSESDVLDPLVGIIHNEDSERKHGVCMPRILDVFCLNPNRIQQSQSKNSQLATLV